MVMVPLVFDVVGFNVKGLRGNLDALADAIGQGAATTQQMTDAIIERL